MKEQEDQYLFDQYNLIEDEEWLKTEDDIRDYICDLDIDFEDVNDNKQLFLKIEEKYYLVTVIPYFEKVKGDFKDTWVCTGYESIEYYQVKKPLPAKELSKEGILNKISLNYDKLGFKSKKQLINHFKYNNDYNNLIKINNE